MSLNNLKKVASAILESYLNIRKSLWQLDLNNVKNLDPTAKTKKDICVTFFEKLQAAQTIQDFIQIIHDISTAARNELANAGYIRNRNPLVYKTLCAVRSYLIYELQRSDEVVLFEGNREKISYVFNKAKETLRDDYLKTQGPDKNEKLEKLANLNDRYAELKRDSLGIKTDLGFTPQYHEQYFDMIIKPSDPLATTRDENNFFEFESNVLANNRKIDLFERLLKAKQEQLVEEANAAKAEADAEHQADSEHKADAKSVPEAKSAPEAKKEVVDTSITPTKSVGDKQAVLEVEAKAKRPSSIITIDNSPKPQPKPRSFVATSAEPSSSFASFFKDAAAPRSEVAPTNDKHDRYDDRSAKIHNYASKRPTPRHSTSAKR